MSLSDKRLVRKGYYYFYPEEDVKEFMKQNREIDLEVIDLLESLKELTVDGKLPFGTCDYINIDDLIEKIKNKDKLVGDKLI